MKTRTFVLPVFILFVVTGLIWSCERGEERIIENLTGYDNELTPGEAEVNHYYHYKNVYEGINGLVDTTVLNQCFCFNNDSQIEIQVFHLGRMTTRVMRVVLNKEGGVLQILVRGDYGKEWHAYTPDRYKLVYNTLSNNIISGEILYGGTSNDSLEYSFKGIFKCENDSARVIRFNHIALHNN